MFFPDARSAVGKKCMLSNCIIADENAKVKCWQILTLVLTFHWCSPKEPYCIDQ